MKQAVVLALAAALPAQNWFVPADHWFVRLRLSDPAGIAKAYQPSALGAMTQDGEVREALAAILQQLQQGNAAHDQLRAAARKLSLLRAEEMLQDSLLQLDPADVLTVELVALLDKTEASHMPQTLGLLAPQPRAEGRIAGICQQLCEEMARGRNSVRAGEQKVGGYPADIYGPREQAEEQSYLPEWYGRFGVLHLPGQFVYGTGDMAMLGTFGARPRQQPQPGIDFAVRFANIPSEANEVAAYGIDDKGDMTMALRFVGPLLQGDFGIDCLPAGLLLALVSGEAKRIRQPLGDVGLLQLHASLGVDAVGRLVEQFTRMIGINADVSAQLAAFDGGLALGITAPPPGSLIPRVFLSLSLKDPQAFADLLQSIPQTKDGPKLEARKLADHDCTLVRLPDVPAALQPSFCVVDGTLHIAESPQSLTVLLRAVDDPAAAGGIAEAPLPQGDGELLASFDLRYDFAAIYRCYHKLWMTPLRLLLLAEAGSSFMPLPALLPLAEAEVMPSPELVAQHLRPGRAVLRRSGNRLIYQESSPLGGPVLTPLMAAYTIVITSRFGNSSNYQLRDLENRIEKHLLEQLASALQKFQSNNGRPAKDLAELATAGLLGEDSLVFPGDASPEQFPFTDRDGKAAVLKSSFAYLSAGVKLTSYQGDATAVAVRRRAPAKETQSGSVLAMVEYSNAVFLGSDGTVREEYGDDDFRKALQKLAEPAAGK